jgi:transposase
MANDRACVPGDENTQIVKAFGNYTVDLQALAEWMKSYQIKTVAMESTGVYWIPLFEELERQGFECLLISSRSLRRVATVKVGTFSLLKWAHFRLQKTVAGRKSDITDAQWIQTLHTYGWLEGSFRPQADLVALRTLLRHRSQLVEHRSPHIQHMQKALLQMNVQLSQAVTDITGLTGQKIIRAILTGVRDPQTLAALREPGRKKSEEEIGKALTGTWREEHLFVLNQSVLLYDFYTQQIQACDEEIEHLYGLTRPDWEAGEVEPFSRRK